MDWLLAGVIKRNKPKENIKGTDSSPFSQITQMVFAYGKLGRRILIAMIALNNEMPTSKHCAVAVTKRGAGVAVKSRSVFMNTIKIS